MNFSIEYPSNLTDQEQIAINEIASHSFGFDDPDEMLEDTVAHLNAAEYVQRTLLGQETIAFGFIPILIGENSYKKNTQYLGFKASKETNITL